MVTSMDDDRSSLDSTSARARVFAGRNARSEISNRYSLFVRVVRRRRNEFTRITMNRSSSVLTNILNRRSDLRADSDSDSPANSTGQMPFYDSESSSDDSCPPSSSRPACCLICSILPNLSSINSCPKHLSLLTSTAIAPNQVVYMMHPAVDGCYCPSRPSQRRKRSMTVESSSSEDEHFFSPTQLTKPSSPFNQ